MVQRIDYFLKRLLPAWDSCLYSEIPATYPTAPTIWLRSTFFPKSCENNLLSGTIFGL